MCDDLRHVLTTTRPAYCKRCGAGVTQVLADYGAGGFEVTQHIIGRSIHLAPLETPLRATQTQDP